MKLVYVIHEKDLEDMEQTVIGIADDLGKIPAMIDEYYGEFIELSHTDIDDCSLVWEKTLKVSYKPSWKVEVLVESFNINQV